MADNWYVGRNGERTGPFTAAQVRQMAAGGGLKPTDMVWKEGMANWVAASTIRGLFAGPSIPAPVVGPPAVSGGTDFQFTQPGAQSTFARPMEYAEYMPRVGAALLDSLFVGLMGCIPGIGIGVLFMALAGNDSDAQGGAAVLANLCAQLVGLLIGVTYYVVLETSPKQGTWGKQIVGIKVTDLEGNRITVGRALGRYFAKMLTSCTFGIGLLMPLFTEKKQTLHDMIAGCLALKK